LGVKVKNDEMRKACAVARMEVDVHTKFRQDNLEERVGLEDLGVDERKIL
jgi:hypothetical protein